MTSRERVLRALEFGRPDRAPRDLWAIPWMQLFGQERLEALRAKFPMDLAYIGGPARGERQQGQEFRKGKYVDAWGCVFQVGEDGVVGEVKAPPLADWSALTSYRPPWETIERADWDAANRTCQDNIRRRGLFNLGGSTVRPFERMQFLRGSENLYLDLGYETAEFFRLLEMVHEFFLKELAGWAATEVDAVTMQDDWGSQQALLISPQQWRRVFKPLYRQYCQVLRSAGKKVFFHSDGHILDIYEDLIEVGVDAVNSQLFCMDIEEIGRRLRGRITFWGEIDRQQILHRGSVDEVRRAVARVRRAIDDGTGGVIAQCSWGVNDPTENIEAVYEAWDEPLEDLAGENQ